jgi:hypothetical protein
MCFEVSLFDIVFPLLVAIAHSQICTDAPDTPRSLIIAEDVNRLYDFFSAYQLVPHLRVHEPKRSEALQPTSAAGENSQFRQ